MQRQRSWLAIAFVAGLTACGGGGANGGGEAAAPSQGQVTIIFENTQFEDATVYVEAAGSQRRLGRVGGTSTERFRVPYSPTGYVVEASFTAIGEFQTDLILADPGSTITVEAQSTGNLIFSIG